MNHKRRVYLLDPQSIPPETIAVAFAKTSRSPASFDEIAAELTNETSSEFHEKWVVGYGHSSVAEHAVIHIALENISRLAIEPVESNRLASYTEKSTRYQKWDANLYYFPQELAGHPLGVIYESTVKDLFSTYQKSLEPVKSVVAREFPKNPGESDAAWDRRVRSEYVDVCRFLLPAASLANVGMTINARSLEHAIRKLLSHPLLEVQQIGEEIKQVALQTIPTLVKYVDRVPFLQQIGTDFQQEAERTILGIHSGDDWCNLVDYDKQGVNKVLSALLFRYSDLSFEQAMAYMDGQPEPEVDRLVRLLMNRLGDHDEPIREMEYATFLFEIILDQGAYFELKRHRMLTLTSQNLTTRLGYAIPRLVVEAGLENTYRDQLEKVQEAYEKLADYNPAVASYIVPNGFNRRVLLNINLRSAMHLISLRSAGNAHFSIRRMAQKMAAEIITQMPLMDGILRRNPEETYQEIEQRYFSQTR